MLEFFLLVVELADADREVVVDHRDLSLGEHFLRDEDVDRLSRHAVELDEAPFFQMEQLADAHAGLSQLDGDGRLYIEEHLDAVCHNEPLFLIIIYRINCKESLSASNRITPVPNIIPAITPAAAVF